MQLDAAHQTFFVVEPTKEPPKKSASQSDDTDTDPETLTDSMMENALKIIADSIKKKVDKVRAQDKQRAQYEPSAGTDSVRDAGMSYIISQLTLCSIRSG